MNYVKQVNSVGLKNEEINIILRHSLVPFLLIVSRPLRFIIVGKPLIYGSVLDMILQCADKRLWHSNARHHNAYMCKWAFLPPWACWSQVFQPKLAAALVWWMHNSGKEMMKQRILWSTINQHLKKSSHCHARCFKGHWVDLHLVYHGNEQQLWAINNKKAIKQ